MLLKELSSKHDSRARGMVLDSISSFCRLRAIVVSISSLRIENLKRGGFLRVSNSNVGPNMVTRIKPCVMCESFKNSSEGEGGLCGHVIHTTFGRCKEIK